MAVLERSELSESSLADLHALARELEIENYRLMRKEELVDALVGAQAQAPQTSERSGSPLRRWRRGRSRGRPLSPVEAEGGQADLSQEEQAESELELAVEEPTVEGTIELQENGSALLEVNPEEFIYISSAQVRRCELVSGDLVGGPIRPKRRSEKYAALVRIDTIAGKPVEAVVEGVRFSDLPVAFPNELLSVGTEIDSLTPIGKGSRVVITGPAFSGKTEVLRQITRTFADNKDLTLLLVLSGPRQEEILEWESGPTKALAVRPLGTTPETQGRVIQQAIEQARRIAVRGGDAVVLIDTLTFQHPVIARKMLANARNIADGGSLTIIATSERTYGGETTVIGLDPTLAGARRYPPIDLKRSGTLKPDSLVGQVRAKEIASAYAKLAPQ